MSIAVPFPPATKMILQVVVFFIIEDAWHYWTHRALHASPFLYRTIHKTHHRYATPFGLTALYASPFEVMILGAGTIGAPLVWAAVTGDLHIITMYVWITARLLQAVDAHSGYDFPWSLHRFLPVWAGAEHHDVHHEKFVGNYASSFRWWDYLMGTESKTSRGHSQVGKMEKTE